MRTSRSSDPKRNLVLVPLVTLMLVLIIPRAGAQTPLPDNREVTPNVSIALQGDRPDAFSFAVAADMRYFAGPGQYDTAEYFRGAVEAIAALGGGEFLITPGDMDPPSRVLWTITCTLGANYKWYPVVGNHDLPGWGNEPSLGANMRWLNAYDYGDVYPGPTGCPTTTYSFDYKNAHFVMLNEYCDSYGEGVIGGDIPGHLYDWLANDLRSTDKHHIFVVGHEPAYPQPDADNGRVRHLGDSLDLYPERRDRFWNLLRENKVVAYICGHTHNYSAAKLDGVWQLDAAHAQGIGGAGARSTFVMVHVTDYVVKFEAYRDDERGGQYTKMHEGYLRTAEPVRLPLILCAHS